MASAAGTLESVCYTVCGEGPLPPTPFLINFNPSWIDTFIKFNKNESLEKMK